MAQAEGVGVKRQDVRAAVLKQNGIEVIVIETACNYTDKTMFVSSDQQKWINRIRKLKSEHPEQVKILYEPEQNDGCIYATVPAEWLRITPPRASTMTDEQKQMASERMKALVEKQKRDKLIQKQDE